MLSSLSWSFTTPASPIIGSAVPSTTAPIRSSTRRLSLPEYNPHSHVLSYSIPMSIFTLVQSRRRLLTLISPSYTPSTIHCNTHAVSPPPHPAFEATSFVHVQDEPARHAEVGTVPQPATQAGSPSVTELHHHGTPQASACIHRCGRQIRTHVSARYPAL